MWKTAVVGVAIAIPLTAFGCEGKKTTTAAVQEVEVSAEKASHCAKKAELMGTACSYSTGMMAQRVIAEGDNYAFTGSLIASENGLSSKVAAPYTIGPNGSIHVVANEVVEQLNASNVADQRLSLTGKLLDVDGVKYFVLTGYSAPSS